MPQNYTEIAATSFLATFGLSWLEIGKQKEFV